ncbi:DUF378 domain-containing protein [Sporosarcina psychrophila]|uniref:Uncharacterized membrane protein YuzA (DUF378 family) n=1 Tax=Sporosarcina psychrophila TaxID=1476 RepID=A0ABV2KEH0_SPOPS
MSKVHKIALALTIIGALNWGVAGIFRFDVVAQFAGGSAEPLARFIYIIIGVSGLINLGLLFNQRQNHDEVIVSVPEKV